ncbi:SCO3374 family protein [Streptomyces bluensis]|uniref:SCO3374 family protein n=1 Tax=Streptomyces bluensis TaxID=33897 RepID=UPI003325CE08
MASIVPLPRRPLDSGDRVREWYENGLGWTTLPGSPVRLSTGVRFDVLDVPAEAGFAALRHLGPGSPVALCGDRMALLVAAGSADELPGLLDWLDWGTLELDLTAIGAGGHVEAPRPWPHGSPRPGPRPAHRSGVSLPRPLPRDDRAASGDPRTVPGARTSPLSGRTDTRAPLQPSSVDRAGSQGAALWLRPPEPGCEVELSLPTLSALGGGGSTPDLVRLVDTVATRCHRIRLRRLCAQAFAFS